MRKKKKGELSIYFSDSSGIIAPVDENGLIVIAPGVDGENKVVAHPEFLEDLAGIFNETAEEKAEKERQWKKKLDLILESQEELVFHQWGDLKWSIEIHGGMHWEDFLLLNLNDPEDNVFAFTFQTEYLAEQDKKEALEGGYYREGDFIDKIDSITIKHPAKTYNDFGRIIRFWINKYYPHMQQNPYIFLLGRMIFGTDRSGYLSKHHRH